MDLRNALLKAGKIDEKQKKRADRDQKAQQHQNLKQPDKKADEMPPEPIRTPEEVAAEAAAKKREKLKDLISGGLVDWSGRRRFYFVNRSREILFLQVSDVVGYQLEQGQAAIVEDADGRGDHFVVTQDAALKVQALDRDAVRFFVPGRG